MSTNQDELLYVGSVLKEIVVDFGFEYHTEKITLNSTNNNNNI